MGTRMYACVCPRSFRGQRRLGVPLHQLSVLFSWNSLLLNLKLGGQEIPDPLISASTVLGLQLMGATHRIWPGCWGFGLRSCKACYVTPKLFPQFPFVTFSLQVPCSFLSSVCCSHVGPGTFLLILLSAGITGTRHHARFSCFILMVLSPCSVTPWMLKCYAFHTLPMLTTDVWKVGIVILTHSVAILKHSLTSPSVLVLLVSLSHSRVTWEVGLWRTIFEYFSCCEKTHLNCGQGSWTEQTGESGLSAILCSLLSASDYVCALTSCLTFLLL